MESSNFDRRGAADDDEVLWDDRRDQITMSVPMEIWTAELLGDWAEGEEEAHDDGGREEQTQPIRFEPHDCNQIPIANSVRLGRKEMLDQWSPEPPPLNERDVVGLEHPGYDYEPERARTNLRFGQTSSICGKMGIFFILIAWLSIPVSAVLIPFENCLSDNTRNDVPLQLQIIPLFFDAVFDTVDANHTLMVKSYFNVAGTWDKSIPLPSANETDYWQGNSTSRGGKIQNILPNAANKYTAASARVDVLTYRTWNSNTYFCDQSLKDGVCPVGPRFNVNESDPNSFPNFGFTNPFYSSYAFTTFSTTLSIRYGDAAATSLGCVSAEITPDMGTSLSSVVSFVPLAILICVGFATAFAAVYSPWGTTDTFRWTTNYGRDEDLLRLVTPGFGDCLQYIQFVALTGGLTLNYPGFYQPIVSKVAWSALMFNQSFVDEKTGYSSLVDGIYVTDARYGLDRIRQLIGMGAADDIWAGMMIWLLVIIAAVVSFIQVGFLFRWILRRIQSTPEEDLRAKNFPFSAGNVVRIVFNYFLLPIVALSMFQLVSAGSSPAFTVGLAVVTLVFILAFAIWLFLKIARTRNKVNLFDDLPTLLLYGSLYNTYSDDAALFALVPLFLTFLRGLAIGAIQPSGIAQVVVLAICEVINVLVLHAFRPFHSPTSMNAYHTFFSIIRFSTILLMISFAPSLGVTSGPKGWIGYAILLMHAIVLIFGFLLNAIQTIVEVGARLAGAGGDESGAARGGLAKVFGMRQLSRRLPRREAAVSRQSQLSSAAMLAENERGSFMDGSGRIRSQSAGSAALLTRRSTGLESGSIDPYGAIGSQGLGGGNSAYTPTTPGDASTFSFLPSGPAPSGLGRNRGPILGLGAADTADPYYRPPRPRRPTLEDHSPGGRSRASWTSGGWGNKRWSHQDSSGADKTETEGPSISGRNTPIPGPGLETPNEERRSPADYTTREVDFYYGVRGPALNANIPSRRIKTGPADPTGPAASAAGWFKSLLGGKTKEKGKGFEVVRSARMPPGMQARNAPGQESPPEGIPVATGVIRNGPIDSDDESVNSGIAGPSNAARRKGDEHVDVNDDGVSDDERDHRISDIPPILPGIEIGESGIELPSRFPSKATSKASTRRANASSAMPDFPPEAPSRMPTVPRKSSRRKSQSVDLPLADSNLLHSHRGQSSMDPTRLPFDRNNSNRRTLSTRSSNPADELETPSPFSADLLSERPTSMGFVHQHNIRTITPTTRPEYIGSSAEVVDSRRLSSASSIEHLRR